MSFWEQQARSMTPVETHIGELPDQFPDAPAAVIASLAEYRRMVAETRTARADVAAAEAAVTNATHADVIAGAAARRAGKPDPGGKNRDAAEKALQVAQRSLSSCELAVTQVQGELRNHVAGAEPSWPAALDQRLADARTRIHAALDEYQAALSERAHLRSVREFASTSRQQGWKFQPANVVAARTAQEQGKLKVGALRADADE